MNANRTTQQIAQRETVEAEAALLGAMMTDDWLVDEVVELVPADAWWRSDHRALAALLQRMAAEGQAIDVVTVMDAIGASPDTFGGVEYVLGLPDRCPSPRGWRSYAEIVVEGARRRQAVAALEATLDRMREDVHTDAAQVVTQAIEELHGAVADRDQVHAVDQGQAAAQARDRIRSGASTQGPPVGLYELGRLLPRFRPGELIVLGARPAMGKTALACHFEREAVKAGFGVHVRSLEMSAAELAERHITAISPIPAEVITSGQLTDDEWSEWDRAEQRMATWTSSVVDQGNATVDDVIAGARVAKRRFEAQGVKLGLVIIDYLTLLSFDGHRDLRLGVTDATRKLKLAAKDLGCAVLLLAQLSRDLEKRTDKRPRPSDLRESGSIEQDADAILFVHREVVFDPDYERPDEAEIIVGKQRKGRTGTARVTFQRSHQRFISDGGQDFKL